MDLTRARSDERRPCADAQRPRALRTAMLGHSCGKRLAGSMSGRRGRRDRRASLSARAGTTAPGASAIRRTSTSYARLERPSGARASEGGGCEALRAQLSADGRGGLEERAATPWHGRRWEPASATRSRWSITGSPSGRADPRGGELRAGAIPNSTALRQSAAASAKSLTELKPPAAVVPSAAIMCRRRTRCKCLDGTRGRVNRRFQRVALGGINERRPVDNDHIGR
jgi:hypothetical protein